MRRFGFGIAAIALLGLALAGTARANCVTPASNPNVPQPPGQGTPVFGAGNQTNGAATLQPAGCLFDTTATAATATGTSEQVLATYSLPANSLDYIGRRLKIHAMFSKAANTDSVTAKLYFGSEVVSSGANTTSGAGMTLDLIVVKTGASTQIVTGQGLSGTTAVTPYSAAGAETDTAAIVIKASCTDGTSAAADCTLQDMEIDYVN